MLYISLLSGVDYEILDQFPMGSIIDLTDAIRFIWETDFVMVKDFKGLGFEPLGDLKVIQFEHWKQKLSQIEDETELMPYTIALLKSGEYKYNNRWDYVMETYKLPADIGIYCRNFYNNGFADHLKKYAPLYSEQELEEEQLRAGAEQLGKWGFQSTLHSLAGGDILKKEKIATDITVDEVYTHLSYSKAEQQYTKNYQKEVINAIQRGTRTD
jgi:hypothetical protein